MSARRESVSGASKRHVFTAVGRSGLGLHSPFLVFYTHPALVSNQGGFDFCSFLTCFFDRSAFVHGMSAGSAFMMLKLRPVPLLPCHEPWRERQRRKAPTASKASFGFGTCMGELEM